MYTVWDTALPEERLSRPKVAPKADVMNSYCMFRCILLIQAQAFVARSTSGHPQSRMRYTHGGDSGTTEPHTAVSLLSTAQIALPFSYACTWYLMITVISHSAAGDSYNTKRTPEVNAIGNLIALRSATQKNTHTQMKLS